ncbi:MAG: cytochrome c maturation protein CcmE [Planctomycetota bacterium]|nr:cytochrome c maturation protein CcmE [Planctomycetota bacterium]
MRLFLIGAIFVVAAGTLVSLGVLSKGIPVLKVSDLFAAETKPEPGQTVRVDNGKIVSIEAMTPSLRFHYANDQDPSKVILVESSRNPPENFRVGIGASIKGTYDTDGKVFKAYQVSTNCPSRYDPKEELKKIDQQQKVDGAAPAYQEATPSTSMRKSQGKDPSAIGVSGG